MTVEEATMPARKDMPSTLKRSPKKAQETYAKTHDSAVDSYGEGERAHRTAFSAVKHSFEKVGDHWEAKDHKGPSDAPAARSNGAKSGKTAGGVDANATKEHLMGLARKLDITGRSKMTKAELVKAIQKANNRKTTQARARSLPASRPATGPARVTAAGPSPSAEPLAARISPQIAAQHRVICRPQFRPLSEPPRFDREYDLQRTPVPEQPSDVVVPGDPFGFRAAGHPPGNQ
jgi:cation transport regulator ChaB